MGDKPIPVHADDAPSSGETLHETVTDDGHVRIYHRFKPGDLVSDDDGDQACITEVFLGYSGRAEYGFRWCEWGSFDNHFVASADRLWTLIEGGES